MSHLNAFTIVSVLTNLLAWPLQPATLGQDSGLLQAGYRGAAEPTTAAAVYGEGVRSTDWQTPADEQRGFHLPPGFKIELFASEPQIAKPLNMAWDARGRLWVTSSREYPYPAAEGTAARDTLQILEDTDGDGRADKSTTFADNLNIPIGVLPVPQGAICFSIPHLWLLRDTDGDDRADERIRLLGPFDTTRDTHGMVNSLTRGDDGWIYACHGFNNQSDVTAADGSRVQLTSGNTFRFRDDGSRVEQVTHGQVNPFGMTRDEWGNWYAADCHSKPLTALLPGACYPSFARPHDGLGFGPSMMDHLHGSTAICGLEYYQAEAFPPAYRRLFYSGNVMTSRINCNVLQWQGSTAKAAELADFLTSDDPWFRPVDIRLGPDGALYVADFYNRIIGHYEVPLDHPGRDRDSGRIWKISYVGQQPAQPLTLTSDQLSTELASSNETRRRLAIELALHSDSLTVDELSQLWRDPRASEQQLLSCMELLFRQRSWETTHAAPLPTDTRHTRLLVRQLALAAELPQPARKPFVAAIKRQLPYAEPQAQRQAIRLIGLAGTAADVEWLSSWLQSSDAASAHTARIAIREILRDPQQLQLAMRQAAGQPWEALLAEILPAVDTQQSASLLVDHVAAHLDSPPRLIEACVRLATKHASDGLLQKLRGIHERTYPQDWSAQAQQLENMCSAYLGTHTQLPAILTEWGRELQAKLSEQLLRQRTEPAAQLWMSDSSGADWGTETRRDATQTTASLRSSLTRGEAYVGQLVSEPFTCPRELSFWLAGHNGRPNQADSRLNKVELQLITSGASLQVAWPPRSDIAQEIKWDLSKHVGQQVRLVVTDAEAGRAYAWLAVGQFSLTRLNAAAEGPLLEDYVKLVQRGFAEVPQELLKALPRQAAAVTFAANLQGQGQTTASLLASQAIAWGRADLLTPLFGVIPLPEQLLELGRQLATTATLQQQRTWVAQLVRTAEGCRLVEQLCSDGRLALSSLPLTEVVWPRGLAESTREYLQSQIAAAQTQTAPVVDVAERISKLDWSTSQLELGQQLYQQHCAACHQLRGQGAVVGPQLDGAIARSRQRLCEDILNPHLNVDKAFRISALLLDDDSVVSGLVREQSDGTLVVTGQDGRSQQLPVSRVTERRDLLASLMPANFGELLNDQQLVALLSYLTNRE